MLGTTNPTSNPQPTSVNPVTTATTTPLATKVGAPAPQTPPRSPKQPKKIFGVDQRALLTVLGLTLFFVLSMAGVVISLRQRLNRETVAPNAPESQVSADVVTPANCSLSFLVVADEEEPEPTPPDEEEPEPTPPDEEEPEPTPPDEEEPEPTPPDEEEPDKFACNSVCETNAECATADEDYVCYNNRCRLQTNISSQSCRQPGGGSTQYSCNSACQTNEQCRTANEFFLCHNGQCRLDINLNSATCQEPTDQKQAQVSCNDACAANTDCTNAAHICYNGQCRLETNPESATCTRPAAPATPTVPGETQPELPAELPKTGPEDWGNWLKAGLAALGVGAVLLLLL